MVSGFLRRLVKKATGRRSVQCICLGAAKTGTTSFAAMFDNSYRTAHEPDPAVLTSAVAKVLAGDSPDTELITWLQERDRRLQLEVEASHPLGYLAPWLPRAFPAAQFVITLREPLPWLKSRLNFHYFKSPPQWQRYRELIWSRWHQGYSKQEAGLERLGLYSLDAYLSQYAEQYRILFNHLPKHRRLLINTDALDVSAARIAEFLAIKPTGVRPRHANQLVVETSIIDQLPADFVAERIHHHCDWLTPYLADANDQSEESDRAA